MRKLPEVIWKPPRRFSLEVESLFAQIGMRPTRGGPRNVPAGRTRALALALAAGIGAAKVSCVSAEQTLYRNEARGTALSLNSDAMGAWYRSNDAWFGESESFLGADVDHWADFGLEPTLSFATRAGRGSLVAAGLQLLGHRSAARIRRRVQHQLLERAARRDDAAARLLGAATAALFLVAPKPLRCAQIARTSLEGAGMILGVARHSQARTVRGFGLRQRNGTD